MLRGGGHRGGLSFGPQMVSVDRAEMPRGWLDQTRTPALHCGRHDLSGDPGRSLSVQVKASSRQTHPPSRVPASRSPAGPPSPCARSRSVHPCRSRQAGTVRDLSAGCGRPDTRQLADRITPIERFEENAPSRPLARHPGCAGCRCRTPNGRSAPGICDPGSLTEGLAYGHRGGACAHRASPLLSAGGGADADGRAAGPVARCRARCPASAPAPVITPTTVTPRAHPYLPARPGPVCRRSGCC